MSVHFYLVGGYVRDLLLHLNGIETEIGDKDWVVVGANENYMTQRGFISVGKSFPVFLHRTTKEEYALARKENKVGAGYHGFTFDVDASITLEEDLLRRDLTINAMAWDPINAEIIDPFHGAQDLQNKVLRHVSEHFQEDPVRCLRLARLACKLPGFKVHPDTCVLIEKMIQAGELDALEPNRIWKEFSRAMMSCQPENYFLVLEETQALSKLYPELQFTQKASERLKKAALENLPLEARVAAVWLDVLTPALVDDFAEKRAVPKVVCEFLRLCLTTKGLLNQNETCETICEYLRAGDVLRKKTRFELLLQLSELINGPCVRWHKAIAAFTGINIQSVIQKCEDKSQIAQAIERARFQAVKQALAD